MMTASSTQSLPNSQGRSRMEIYVPGIILRSIMSCGGPSFFLQRSIEPSPQINGTTTSSSQYQLLKICSKDLPDSQTVRQWLQNGSMNWEKLQNVKEGKLRKLITTSTGALPLIKKSFQVSEAPKPKPSKASWPVNHSKVARCQQRKLENKDEENFIKEALQGLIIGLSSAVLFCSILFRFVLKNKV
uniref:DLA class II histocompatibility antigen, DR-1 beta chain n=1 Tax=Lygus hesperus TaxID=30085 RepID=A0A0A9Z6H8_LYGHE